MRRAILGLLAPLLISACDMPEPASGPSATSSAPPLAVVTTPSAQSAALRTYYANLQADLLTRGLLRLDGGGPDTPFDADDLAMNFADIVFYDEYRAGSGLQRNGEAESGQLRRWDSPVRMAVEFGASVPDDRRARDQAEIRNYSLRLARLTGHKVSMATRHSNFHVFVMSYDDRAEIERRIRALVPGIDPETLAVLVDPPRSIFCILAAFLRTGNPQSYDRAIVVIRDEHPDLMRRACIHEELAQGFGLANDSPAARPSIFNDDDEFALLTSHDELLLRMLYDPRLKTGQTLEEAQPAARIIARELLGQEL